MKQENININIKFFGPLKKYSKYKKLDAILVKPGCTVSEFKNTLLGIITNLEQNSNARSLIMSSAIADDTRVYQNEDKLLKNISLLVLPPVCGG
ncbi:MAG: hypothetical protein KBD25_00250 [Rickettsiaceae bacterium]|nr:hypothetical protein [Rickettsiaceae bacterium]